MARLAEPGQVAGALDHGDKLTFADVPRQLRPSSRYYFNQLPKAPDVHDAEQTIAAYGLSPDEVAREPADRLRWPSGFWRHVVADAHREQAYAEWLYDEGLIDWDPRAQVSAADDEIRKRLGDLADEVGPSRASGPVPREWSPWELLQWDTDRRRAA